jgi:hypothetical protein
MYDMDPNHVKVKKMRPRADVGKKSFASILILTASTTMGIFNFRGNTP